MSAENNYSAFQRWPAGSVSFRGPIESVRAIADGNFLQAAMDRASKLHHEAIEAAHQQLFDPDTAHSAAQKVVDTQLTLEATRSRLSGAEVAQAAAFAALRQFSWERPQQF